jgi:hypothetical protein
MLVFTLPIDLSMLSFLFLFAAVPAASLHARYHGGDHVTPASPDVWSQITHAPSPKAVDLRLRANAVARDSIAACASACLGSAITKSTSCQIGDMACECQFDNAVAIELGAFTCVESACGLFAAASKCPQPPTPQPISGLASQPGGQMEPIAHLTKAYSRPQQTFFSAFRLDRTAPARIGQLNSRPLAPPTPAWWSLRKQSSEIPLIRHS